MPVATTDSTALASTRALAASVQTSLRNALAPLRKFQVIKSKTREIKTG